MTNEPLDPVDALAQLSFRVYALMEQRSSEVGMSVVMARMLGILRDRTPSMSDLGARLQLDKASLSGLVSRAETRGLVRRLRSETDGRAVLVELTPDGQDLTTRGTEQFGADVTDLLDILPSREGTELVALVSELLRADAARSGIDLG